MSNLFRYIQLYSPSQHGSITVMHHLFSWIFFNFFRLSKVLIQIKDQTSLTYDEHGRSQLYQRKNNSNIKS